MGKIGYVSLLAVMVILGVVAPMAQLGYVDRPESGEEWLLIVEYPPNCSQFISSSNTSITDVYEAPCRYFSSIELHWTKTADEAVALANSLRADVVGLYHVDREQPLTVSTYEEHVKQPDKVETRKKYTKK